MILFRAMAGQGAGSDRTASGVAARGAWGHRADKCAREGAGEIG